MIWDANVVIFLVLFTIPRALISFSISFSNPFPDCLLYIVYWQIIQFALNSISPFFHSLLNLKRNGSASLGIGQRMVVPC